MVAGAFHNRLYISDTVCVIITPIDIREIRVELTKRKVHMTKKKVGRPTKYKPEYCQAIIDYFDVEPYTIKDMTITKSDGTQIDKTEEEAINIPMLYKFAMKLGVNIDTLYEWARVHKEFSVALNTARECQLNVLIQNALRDNYSSYFAFQMAKNMFGWRDKVEHTGKDDKPIEHKLSVEFI